MEKGSLPSQLKGQGVCCEVREEQQDPVGGQMLDRYGRNGLVQISPVGRSSGQLEFLGEMICGERG